MAISKKLEIIYHNGQPDGIRSIRRHLSTMTTYVIPRPLLSEAKKLTGINRPGIYYLISETDDNKIAQIYVGQTRNGVSRLADHNRSKDFWNKAIMFLADNKTFSLDMISGLEAYAIDSQHRRLQSSGFEWHDHGGGCHVLQAHTFVSMPFDVENVGSGAAINTMIAFYKKGEDRRGASLYTIKQGDSFYFHVFCDDADSVVDNEYVIELLYGDIIGNYYSQKYPVQFKRDADTGRFCTRVDLTGKQENTEKNMQESKHI